VDHRAGQQKAGPVGGQRRGPRLTGSQARTGVAPGLSGSGTPAATQITVFRRSVGGFGSEQVAAHIGGSRLLWDRGASPASADPDRRRRGALPGGPNDRRPPGRVVPAEAGLSGLGLLVVDGYADLNPGGRPGLGAHAHAEFGIPVIGVAKSRFRTATRTVPVLRGSSMRPLFITAAGMPSADAAALVRRMVGRYRLPDALRRADTLARAGLPAATMTARPPD
jgi:hypothetical protein